MTAHLPPDSAVARAIRPPEPDDVWTLDAQLLAEAVDRLGLIMAYSQATFTGRRRAMPPDPIQRPGVDPKAGMEQMAGDVFETPEAFDAWYAEQGGRALGGLLPPDVG